MELPSEWCYFQNKAKPKAEQLVSIFGENVDYMQGKADLTVECCREQVMIWGYFVACVMNYNRFCLRLGYTVNVVVVFWLLLLK